MRMNLNLDTRLKQKQTQEMRLAPQMIQAIEILQLPGATLLDYVERKLAENDALVIDTPEETPREEDDDSAESGPTDAEIAEWSPDDWDEWRPPRPAGGEETGGKMAALQNTAQEGPSVHERLADQLSLIDAPERVVELARHMVFNLDERGYLAPHRFVLPLLESLSDEGYLEKPLTEIVAAVDGVAAVKVPKAGRNVTAEQIAEAEELRDLNVLEAQEVLSRLRRVRDGGGSNGHGLRDREALLRYPLVEVLDRLDEDYTLEEAEQALALVQTLEPRGIAGRTMSETLVMQLDPQDLLYAEKKRLLEDHLQDLERNRLQRIASAMSLDLEEVQMIIDEFKGLDPRPAGRLVTATARVVHPDVVVTQREDGEYEVDLVKSSVPPLAVSAAAEEVAADPSELERVRKLYQRRIDDARSIIDAIRQRQQTLTRVAQRVFHHQSGFLDHGVDALRPLKMQTVADELGIHVSTVSRAIADKWAQTPQGVHALKFFFAGGTETDDGGVESRHSVKRAVQDIIDGEDKKHPMSDDDVASALKERGLSIARRTVTKYRKQLGIPSSRRRRQWV